MQDRLALDREAVDPLLRAALAEDLGPGDVTSACFVPEDARATARIVAKAGGVLAGVAVAARVLDLAAGGGVIVDGEMAEGARVEPGDVVLTATGNARGLLAGERTALNFLGRMSGIATLTARFVAAVEGTGARILDTRKTTPLLRRLERFAVRCGGGENHRFALDDAVLMKENHALFGRDLRDALASRPAGMPGMVEVENLREFDAALAAGADVVLLDEFAPAEVAEALRRRGGDDRPEIEVSGGVTLETVRAYAEAGAERISIGALTHSAPVLDLSLGLRESSRGT